MRLGPLPNGRGSDLVFTRSLRTSGWCVSHSAATRQERTPRLLGRGAVRLPECYGWLAGFALTSVAVAYLGYSIGVANIRMLPFAHGALVLLACYELGTLLAGNTTPGTIARPSLVAGLIVLMIAFAVWQVDYLPSWVRWNLNGLERAPST